MEKIKKFKDLPPADRQNVKLAIKEMYFARDDKGRRIYRHADIIKEVRERFGVEIPLITIRKWIHREGWATEAATAEVQAVVESVEEIAKKLTTTPEFREKLAIAKKAVIANQIELAVRMKNEINQMPPNDNRLARWAEVANKINETLFKMLEDIDPEKAAKGRPASIIIQELQIKNPDELKENG